MEKICKIAYSNLQTIQVKNKPIIDLKVKEFLNVKQYGRNPPVEALLPGHDRVSRILFQPCQFQVRTDKGRLIPLPPRNCISLLSTIVGHTKRSLCGVN
jgi:hypothetical protein